MNKLNYEQLSADIAEAIRRQLNECCEDVKSVKLLSEESKEISISLVRLALFYEDHHLDVSFIVYSTGEWFSPVDWQSWQPETLNEIGEIEWRLGVTNHRAIIIDGQPRLIF